MNQSATPQSRCRFGLAHGDITPPVGGYHRMWGAAKHDRSTGVHRPLRATVVVFQDLHTNEDCTDPESLQIIVALDHCIMGAAEMEGVLRKLTEGTGFPREVFLVVFSHTHAAGLMDLERAELPGGDMIAPYLEKVGETAAQLTREAFGRKCPAAISYGAGRCTLARQRDYWDEESGQFVCGFNPEEEADDTVQIARVSEGGRTLATIVGYACHPTTLAWDNTLISPDYPGAMREVVEQATSAPCLFIQGASGDLGPREGFVGDVGVADRNGRQLGYAVLSALEEMDPAETCFEYTGPVVSGATLGTWEHRPVSEEAREKAAWWQVRRWQLPLSYRPDLPTGEQVEADLIRLQGEEEQASQAGDAARASELRALAERKRRLRGRLARLPTGGAYPLEVVTWRMGDAIWVGVQGEHYQMLQTSLRKRFADTPVVVATIAYDWRVSYLPPRDVYGKGIYQEQVAIVAPGSLERVIDSISQAIEEMLAKS